MTTASAGMLTRAAAARAFSTEALKVVNNVAKQQFTVSIKNLDGYVRYTQNKNDITFVHTEVPKEFRGKGVGKLLAQYAFDHALDKDLNVTCKCHFLADFYKDNIQKYKSLNVKLDLD